MKISPLASGSGEPGDMNGQVDLGHSAGRERKEQAKRAFKGEAPVSLSQSETPTDQDLSRHQKRVLKMRTNATPGRIENFEIPQESLNTEPQAQAQENAIPDNNEAPEADATKPLSPQFAALARQKRALQVKERELVQREEALKSQPQAQAEGGDWKADLKANPLAKLREAGVSYDDLTQAILENPQGSQSFDVQAIEERLLKAVEDKLSKNLQERDTDSRKQVVSQMTREANYLIAQGDTYELVRKTKSVGDAIELIERTFDKDGEILEVPEALRLIEDELQADILDIAQAQKIQKAFSPKPQASQAPPGQMRTLTSRDSSGAQPMSAKQRALLAFAGKLQRG